MIDAAIWRTMLVINGTAVKVLKVILEDVLLSCNLTMFNLL